MGSTQGQESWSPYMGNIPKSIVERNGLYTKLVDDLSGPGSDQNELLIGTCWGIFCSDMPLLAVEVMKVLR